MGAALVLSGQNMDLLADSSSVRISAVVAAAAAESPILPSVQHNSEAEEGDKRREFIKFGRQYYAHRLNESSGKFGTSLNVESNL